MILNDIKVSVDYTTEEIKQAISKKLKISPKKIKDFDIVKRSIDARKSDVKFSLSINANITGREYSHDTHSYIVPTAKSKLTHKPIIIGAGPAGLFAGLILAKAGLYPVIIERGKAIEDRNKDVEIFKSTSNLNLQSNICFGEGGAGTFSDGKLVSRSNDVRSKYILNEFVKHGADEKILIDAKPHIGTDILSGIIVNLRKEIISLGGTFCFDEQMLDIVNKNNKASAVITNKRTVETNHVILAIGHSARDTYESILKNNIDMTAKGFALGVRIEHPREVIDKGMYANYANHPRLGAAYYNLKGKFNNHNVYSFCMCPGGEVVNSSTENGALSINGMSYNSRDGINSNAAIVCQVNPNLWGDNVLGGINYQRAFEKKAFEYGGGNFIAPAQTLKDFKLGNISKQFSSVKPSIQPGTNMADINEILGNEISDAIKSAVEYWNRIIKGYSMDDAVLTAIESRTSAPLRIIRDKSMQSTSLKGLYPCGEGAGYAGGIMSAAIDGIKCAEAVINSDE